MSAERRTKRRYAHEMYPHGGEFEVRPLPVEVPYLYARAIGFDVMDTGWADDRTREGIERSVNRTDQMVEARHLALLADALAQGLAGEEAWQWAEERRDESGEWVYERAVHYGVDPKLIKPYPCGPERDWHWHYKPWPGHDNWRECLRTEGRESECPDCTEEVPTDTPAPAASSPASQAVTGTVAEPSAAAAPVARDTGMCRCGHPIGEHDADGNGWCTGSTVWVDAQSDWLACDCKGYAPVGGAS